MKSQIGVRHFPAVTILKCINNFKLYLKHFGFPCPLTPLKLMSLLFGMRLLLKSSAHIHSGDNKT